MLLKKIMAFIIRNGRKKIILRNLFSLIEQSYDLKELKFICAIICRGSTSISWLKTCMGCESQIKNLSENFRRDLLTISSKYGFFDNLQIQIVKLINRYGTQGITIENLILHLDLNVNKIKFYFGLIAKTKSLMRKKKNVSCTRNLDFNQKFKIKLFFKSRILDHLSDKKGKNPETFFIIMVSKVVARYNNVIGNKCLKYGIFSLEHVFKIENMKKLHRLWQKIRKKYIKSGILYKQNENKIKNSPSNKVIVISQKGNYNNNYFVKDPVKKGNLSPVFFSKLFKTFPGVKISKMIFKSNLKGCISSEIFDQFRGFMKRKKIHNLLRNIYNTYIIRKKFGQIGRQRMIIFSIGYPTGGHFRTKGKLMEPKNVGSLSCQFNNRLKLVQMWTKHQFISIKGLGRKIALHESKGLSKVDSKVIKRILKYLVKKGKIKIMKFIFISKNRKKNGIEFIINKKFSFHSNFNISKILLEKDNFKITNFGYDKMKRLPNYQFTRFIKLLSKGFIPPLEPPKIINGVSIWFFFGKFELLSQFLHSLLVHMIFEKLENLIKLDCNNLKKIFYGSNKINRLLFLPQNFFIVEILLKKIKKPFPFRRQIFGKSHFFLTSFPAFSIFKELKINNKPKCNIGSLKPSQFVNFNSIKISIKRSSLNQRKKTKKFYRSLELKNKFESPFYSNDNVTWGSEFDAIICVTFYSEKFLSKLQNQTKKKSIPNYIKRRIKIVWDLPNIQISSKLFYNVTKGLNFRVQSYKSLSSLYFFKRGLELPEGSFLFFFQKSGPNFLEKKMDYHNVLKKDILSKNLGCITVKKVFSPKFYLNEIYILFDLIFLNNEPFQLFQNRNFRRIKTLKSSLYLRNLRNINSLLRLNQKCYSLFFDVQMIDNLIIKKKLNFEKFRPNQNLNLGKPSFINSLELRILKKRQLFSHKEAVFNFNQQRKILIHRKNDPKIIKNQNINNMVFQHVFNSDYFLKRLTWNCSAFKSLRLMGSPNCWFSKFFHFVERNSVGKFFYNSNSQIIRIRMLFSYFLSTILLEVCESMFFSYFSVEYLTKNIRLCKNDLPKLVTQYLEKIKVIKKELINCKSILGKTILISKPKLNIKHQAQNNFFSQEHIYLDIFENRNPFD